MAEVLHGRLVRALAVATLLFATAVFALNAPALIFISNSFLVPVAAAVCFAYTPVAYGALTVRRPTQGDYLGLGIFFGWGGTFLMRVIALVARDLGWPDIANTHWTSLSILLSLVGGFCHLYAPNADEARTTRQRWMLPGIAVGVGVAITIALWWLAVPHPHFRLD